MYEQKKQIGKKVTNKNIFCRQSVSPEKVKGVTGQKNRTTGQKRALQQRSLFSMGFKKQKLCQQNKVMQDRVQILYSVKQLLKQVSIQEILQNCPQVLKLYELLCSKSYLNTNFIRRLLNKYFHGSVTSLWVNKYCPNEFNDLVQVQFAQKLQEWIKDFYYFRKNSNFDDQFGFDDDQKKEEEYEKSMKLRMKQNGWNCKALVLKGRGGVGKTCFINSIAKSMGIKCFEFASDVDQLQKMKELFDGASSEVVINFHNKKKQVQNNKIIMQNKSITKFLPQTATKQVLETKQPKRLQVFKDFQLYFPPHQKSDRHGLEQSYLRFLFDSINKSPIPYVLTTNDFEPHFRQKSLEQKFSKFDQIEFVQNSIQQIAGLFWVIYEIEYNLEFDPCKKIKKNELFEQLNRQLSSLCIQIFDNIDLIKRLVIKGNKKLLYVSNFLQFLVLSHFKYSHQRNQDFHRILFQNAIQKIEVQIFSNITSHDLLNNFQWDLVDRKLKENVENYLQPTAEDENENFEQSKEHFNEKFEIKQSLAEIKMRLQVEVIENRKVYQNEFYHFQEQSFNNNSVMEIPIKLHLDAKKNIAISFRKRKKELGMYRLGAKDLYYLPLVNGIKRSKNGNKEICYFSQISQNLGKLFNSRQVCYLQTFAKFVFQQL